MNFDATFVGIIIMLLIFIPVAYMIISASRKDKKTIKTLKQTAQANGLTLKDIDVIGNLVIGVDQNSKKLVFTTKRNVTNDFKVIDLHQAKACRAKSIKESEKILQWVGLEILLKQGRQEIQFYCEDDESGLTKDPYVCLQDAKRWEETLRPLLAKVA